MEVSFDVAEVFRGTLTMFACNCAGLGGAQTLANFMEEIEQKRLDILTVL